MIKKLIPNYYYKTIYDIPYNQLYDKGIRLILTDLDNTLVSYKVKEPTEEVIELKNKLEELGFEIIIISNSKKDRVDLFASKFGVKYEKFCMKPLKKGILKAINKVADKKYDKSEIIMIGDQLMTDVLGGKRCGLEVILVEPIDKSTDVNTTKFNRKLESFFINRIKKKCPNEYNLYLKEFAGDIDDSEKM